MTRSTLMTAGDLCLSSPDGLTRLGLAPGSGGRWSSLQHADLEFLGRGGEAAFDWGCFVMAPFAGRIRHGLLEWNGRRHQLPLAMPPHALHGVTVDRAWEVISARDDSAELRCDFDSRWPFSGHATQVVRVEPGRVHARVEVHAHDEPMPGWSGFHPWFARRLARGEAAQIDLRSARYLPRDEEGMPILEPAAAPGGPWDDVFVELDGPAALTWPGAARLEVHSAAPYVVVFDAKPDGICIEPQNAPPNALELGAAPIIEPGAPLVLEMDIRIALA